MSMFQPSHRYTYNSLQTVFLCCVKYYYIKATTGYNIYFKTLQLLLHVRTKKTVNFKFDFANVQNGTSVGKVPLIRGSFCLKVYYKQSCRFEVKYFALAHKSSFSNINHSCEPQVNKTNNGKDHIRYVGVFIILNITNTITYKGDRPVVEQQ